MDLRDAVIGRTYTVKEVKTGDEELEKFLFRLGCYSGEPVTVVSRLKSGCVVSIKDGRYNIDDGIAEGHQNLNGCAGRTVLRKIAGCPSRFFSEK